mmetsp:Transcript_40867/g.130534  ORF Transcript_40867/g.130534 Transcript_40867/m.130534 type:complete len:248 (-) Transcript_40867:1690-2433(-)
MRHLLRGAPGGRDARAELRALLLRRVLARVHSQCDRGWGGVPEFAVPSAYVRYPGGGRVHGAAGGGGRFGQVPAVQATVIRRGQRAHKVVPGYGLQPRGGVHRGGGRRGSGCDVRVRAQVLLRVHGGGAPPRGLRPGPQVDPQEHCRVGEPQLDPRQLKALPEVQATDREEPGVHAHGLLCSMQVRVLLALPWVVGRTRGADWGLLRLQQVRGVEGRGEVRRGDEEAQDGQGIPGAVHPFLRALGCA